MQHTGPEQTGNSECNHGISSFLLVPHFLLFVSFLFVPFYFHVTHSNTVIHLPHIKELSTFQHSAFQTKQRCTVLEDQLVDLIVVAMEKSESEEMVHDDGSMSQLLWQHLSSQVIFFVLFQFASFPHMVLALNEKVSFFCVQDVTNILV